jgi:peptidyl-tRNA hydrolase, PTH1 family
MAYVVVGLGNPGSEYVKTRHNAGRMAVEHIAKLLGAEAFTYKNLPATKHRALVTTTQVGKEKVTFVLPETMMNLSGKVMPMFVKSNVQAKRMVVVRDDLDMPLGTMKMTVGRGSGGHKGIESIARTLKTKDFIQVKIGISGATSKGLVKKPAGEEKVIKHVIGKFKPEEELILKKQFAKIADVVELVAKDEIERALLLANTK